jgi:hypothetical protein
MPLVNTAASNHFILLFPTDPWRYESVKKEVSSHNGKIYGVVSSAGVSTAAPGRNSVCLTCPPRLAV